MDEVKEKNLKSEISLDGSARWSSFDNRNETLWIDLAKAIP